MDSNDTEITIKTGSINGRQDESEIDAFVDQVLKLANAVLSNSTIEVDIVKHRLVR